MTEAVFLTLGRNRSSHFAFALRTPSAALIMKNTYLRKPAFSKMNLNNIFWQNQVVRDAQWTQIKNHIKKLFFETFLKLLLLLAMLWQVKQI